MPKTTMQTLHEALIEVRKQSDLRRAGAANILIAGEGICLNLSRALNRSGSQWELRCGAKKLLGILCQDWPEYSGNPTFPVPSRRGAWKEYRRAAGGYMWSPKSKYGAARLRLLDWLIDQTKENQV